VRVQDEEGARSKHTSFIDLSHLLFETMRAARIEDKPEEDLNKLAFD